MAPDRRCNDLPAGRGWLSGLISDGVARVAVRFAENAFVAAELSPMFLFSDRPAALVRVQGDQVRADNGAVHKSRLPIRIWHHNTAGLGDLNRSPFFPGEAGHLPSIRTG